MTTGDSRNALRRLRALMRELRMDERMDDAQLLDGSPSSVLPLLHYLLLRSDLSVARDVVSAGYNLSAKSDRQFAAGALRFLAQSWSLSVRLQTDQLLAPGFAEVKLLLLSDVAAEVVRRKRAANPGQQSRAHAPRVAAVSATTAGSPSAASAASAPHGAPAVQQLTTSAPAAAAVSATSVAPAITAHTRPAALVQQQQQQQRQQQEQHQGDATPSPSTADSSVLLSAIVDLASRMDALHALVQHEFAVVGERLTGIEHGVSDLRRAWRGAPAADIRRVSVSSFGAHARAPVADARSEDGGAARVSGTYDARHYEAGARERADSVQSARDDHVGALASWSSELAAVQTVGGSAPVDARVPSAPSHTGDSVSLRLADDIRAWQQLTTNEFVRAMSSRIQSLSGTRGLAQ